MGKGGVKEGELRGVPPGSPRISRGARWGAGLLVLVSLILSTPRATGQERFVAPNPPQLKAASAVAIEVSTGRILYALNPDTPRPPASLTKILTALVVRERLSLDQEVEVPPEARGVDGSRLGLEPGQRFKVRELLHALLLSSANDAAVTLAVAAAGDEAAFVDLMNREAARLGAVESRFSNPHGLPAAGHVSTARDLAILARALLADPFLAEVVAKPSYQIQFPGEPQPRTIRNINDLVGPANPDVVGVKTGYTAEAGKCIVAASRKGGVTVLAVLMNDPALYRDARALLDYGQEAFTAGVDLGTLGPAPSPPENPAAQLTPEGLRKGGVREGVGGGAGQAEPDLGRPVPLRVRAGRALRDWWLALTGAVLLALGLVGWGRRKRARRKNPLGTLRGDGRLRRVLRRWHAARAAEPRAWDALRRISGRG